MTAPSRRDEPVAGSRSTDLLPQWSPWLFHYFSIYVHNFVAKNFGAVRLAGSERAQELVGAPILVALNHPSWWDPMIGTLLAAKLFPERTHHVPIDAESLEKYRVLAKLGFFGIRPHTIAGARLFLETGETILAHRPDALIWITVQGEFTDIRRRPIVVLPGIARMAARMKTGWVLPIAIEYAFWNERYPEALALLGRPLAVAPGRSASDWRKAIAAGLSTCMDELAELSLARDPRGFRTLIQGTGGERGFYDFFRRLSSWVRGRPFHPEHGMPARDEHAPT